MPSTKYDIASAALILVGADPVTSFTANGTAEEIACYHLYQTCLDHWLSLYNWRFATRTEQLSRSVTVPDTLWTATYTQPAGMKLLQTVLDSSGHQIPYDRFEQSILCNASETEDIYAVYTYEPAVSLWPGYFVSLMEVAMANKLSFALAGKIDLKKNYEDDVEKFFRLAKHADSRQQTTRKLNTSGRGTIIEFRRA